MVSISNLTKTAGTDHKERLILFAIALSTVSSILDIVESDPGDAFIYLLAFIMWILPLLIVYFGIKKRKRYLVYLGATYVIITYLITVLAYLIDPYDLSSFFAFLLFSISFLIVIYILALIIRASLQKNMKRRKKKRNLMC